MIDETTVLYYRDMVEELRLEFFGIWDPLHRMESAGGGKRQ